MVASGSLSLYYHGNAKEFAAMSFTMERVALILRDSETQWLGLILWSAVVQAGAIMMSDLWWVNFDQTDAM